MELCTGKREKKREVMEVFLFFRIRKTNWRMKKKPEYFLKYSNKKTIFDSWENFELIKTRKKVEKDLNYWK